MSEGSPQPKNLNRKPSQAETEGITFELDLEKENVLTEAAGALSERMGRILERLKNDLLSNQDMERMDKIRLVVTVAKELWPENDGARVKPKFALQSIAPSSPEVVVRFEYGTSGGDFGHNFGGSGYCISLGLGGILDAKTEEEFDAATDVLNDLIYHETEHIEYRSDEQHIAPEDDVYQAVAYFADHGEIRAFSKQYAFRYTRVFPGEPFRLEKIRSLSGIVGVESYFSSFADPAKQEKYKEVADVAHVFDQIVATTSMYIDYFNNGGGN